jgi:hypothetical protein
MLSSMRPPALDPSFDLTNRWWWHDARSPSEKESSEHTERRHGSRQGVVYGMLQRRMNGVFSVLTRHANPDDAQNRSNWVGLGRGLPQLGMASSYPGWPWHTMHARIRAYSLRIGEPGGERGSCPSERGWQTTPDRAASLSVRLFTCVYAPALVWADSARHRICC